MKTKTLLILAAVLALASLPAYAAVHDKIDAGTPTGGALVAVSTDTAMLVQYVGGVAGGGEVTVAAGGDVSLTVAGAADTTTECPVAGAYGGVMTVANASCDTLGELCDAINFSDDWRCVLVNALRSDSSNNTLATIGATDADLDAGLALKWDTAVALHMTQAVIPNEIIRGFYLRGGNDDSAIVENPWAGSQSALLSYSTNVTTGGAATVNVYSVLPINKRSVLNAAGTGFIGGSETVTTLFTIAGGATGVVREFLPPVLPILGRRGEKLVVRTTATVNLTVPIISYHGVIFTP